MAQQRAALADRLLDESIDAAPNAERCASTLDDHARLGTDWADTPRFARAAALLLGLCRECAQNLRATELGLTPAIMAELDALFPAPRAPRPLEMI